LPFFLWILFGFPNSEGIKALFTLFWFMFWLVFTARALDKSVFELYRKKKIFRQATEELYYKAMNGQIELKTLKKEFLKRVKQIAGAIEMK